MSRSKNERDCIWNEAFTRVQILPTQTPLNSQNDKRQKKVLVPEINVNCCVARLKRVALQIQRKDVDIYIGAGGFSFHGDVLSSDKTYNQHRTTKQEEN